MGCVHTHWEMLAMKGWGSLSHIRSVVEKIKEIFKRLKRLVEL